MEIYSQITNKKNENLVPYILQGLDDEGLKIYNAFNLTAAERTNPQRIFEKFEERLKITKPNFRAARLDLHFYYQGKDESMDDFYTRCRKKSADCTFTPEEEKERFVEQLLASTPIEDFKKWLLAQKADVTIETVLNEGRKHETTLNSIKHINDRGNSMTTPANIDAVCYKCRGQQYNKKGKPKTFCKRCGGDHKKDIDSCPAKDSECYNCHKIGHWAQLCLQPEQGQPSTRTQNKNTARAKQRQTQQCDKQHKYVSDITTMNNYDSEQYFDQDGFETVEYNMISMDIADVTHHGYQRKEVFTKINVKVPERPNDRTKRIINMKVDTGAMGNTLPLRIFRQMMPEKLDSDGLPNKDVANKANNTTLLAYNKTPIKCYGIIDLQCDYEKGDWKTFQFHIVDVPSPAVCGLPMAEALGLITLHSSVDVQTPQQRRERDTLPSKIRNSDPVQEDIRQQLTSRQPEQNDYHNRSVKELPPLIPGQRALYQDLQSGRWAPATVVTRAPEPGSYVIQTDSGQTMRRNRVHLRGRILGTTGPPNPPIMTKTQ